MQSDQSKQRRGRSQLSETGSELKFCLEKASTSRLNNFLNLFNNTMHLK
ncbi:hypothetical protein GCM10027170_13960 [Aliiglaciecola aliphaticivorans]